MKPRSSPHGMRSSVPRAAEAWVDADRKILVRLRDGRLVVVDPESSHLLRVASRRQLMKFQIVNGGEGLLWTSLNEALSVKGFLQQSRSMPQLVQVLPPQRRSHSAA